MPSGLRNVVHGFCGIIEMWPARHVCMGCVSIVHLTLVLSSELEATGGAALKILTAVGIRGSVCLGFVSTDAKQPSLRNSSC
jgi:uncharacterized metal-binding protein